MIESWRGRAACRGRATSVFFTPKPAAEAKAKAVCAECTVRMECLWLAIDERLEGGVFGGATQDERDRVARRLTPRQPTVVGRRMG